MTEVETTEVQEQLTLAENVEQQELEALQAEMRGYV